MRVMKYTEKEEEMSAEEYWKKLNKLCLKCAESCKQSAEAVILSCPSYKAKMSNEFDKEDISLFRVAR